MAFKNMKWADGFFPDLSGTVSAPGPSATQDDQESHVSLSSTSSTVFSTPLPSHSPLPGHQHTESSRPNLSPIFVPTAFTSHHSPTTFGTPDSGYQSGFTPASGTGFQLSPTSPLDRCGKHAYPADFDDPPPLYHFPEEDDDSDDEDYDYHTVVSEAERLLKLYNAGHVVAEVGVNNCWRLQCNRCSKWVSSRTRREASVPIARNITVRAATAPPDPQTVPKMMPADAYEDEVDFQNGRSSSAPPEDIRPPSPETHNPPINPDPTSPSFCAGVVVNWNIEAGPLGRTFPWHRVIHQGATESQLESFRIEIDSAEVTRAFSTKCLGPTNGESCVECKKVTRRLEELKELATDAKPHTNRRFLNYEQLTSQVGDKDSEIRKLRLRCVGLAKKLGNCICKLTDYRRLAFAVAESNIPRLKQFLSVGLRNGASPRKLVNMLGDAVEGNTPNPRPSTDPRTIDVTLMTYILGGRKLLYALSHANGLPSLRTLRNHMAFTRIMPTIGTISISDILHNIREVAAGRTMLRGVNLMVDEVALEERAVHFRHTNSVGGLCWRHSPAVNLVLSTYDSALALVKSLKEDRVYFAKEMTVVAASCFGESGTYPILALPTCKHVKAADSRTVYDAVMEAWRSSGTVEKVGRIWSWSTDGDMVRRIAGYEAFLTQKLSSFCTLLRSPAGIAMNNGLIINPTMLAWYLIRLPGLDTAAVHDLLFPHDPQDVPRAVQLLLGIIALGELDYGAAADANTVSELYGNSQTMVKNTMFCLAKQQELDPTSPFYLFQVGDDPLERLFRKLRMLGGHNSAMNYLQAIDRLGHACDLRGAFMRNPDLEQGERRLSMSRSEGVDHLTMKCWTGDLTAGSCHAASAWSAGRDATLEILTKTSIAPEHYDYDALFADEDVDMLRPWRGGKYPGVDSGIDHSMITPALAPPSPALALPSSALAPSPALAPAPAPTLAPSPAPSPAPALAPSPAPALAPSPAPPIATQSELNPEDSDSDEDNQGDGVSFEESIPADVAPELELPSGRGVTPSDYLNVNGKWVHKQRICRLVISKNFEPKSIVRLLRVRGHTNINARPRDDTNIDPAVLLGPNTFVVGDPILTLLCTETKVSLAVLRTTAIHQDGVSRSSILTSTIQNPAAKVKLTGQILSMTLARKTGASDLADQPLTSATVRAADWLDSDADSDWGWIWNGEYLKVDSVMRGTTGGDGADKVATDKVVLVSVPDASVRLGEGTAARINSMGRSWEIDDKQMGIVCELLWDRTVENKVAAGSIVGVKAANAFPYVFDDGNSALLSDIPTQQLTHEHGEKLNRVCECCGQRCDNPRAHMGVHILCKMRGVEQTLKKPVGDSLPCGFCGESGRAACTVYLKVKKKTATIQSNCRLATPLKYAFAERGSVATPCRNVPVICALCPGALAAGNPSAAQPAQWRYNIEEHLLIAHPEYASPRNPDAQQCLPHNVWTAIGNNRGGGARVGNPAEPDSSPVCSCDRAG
ncbi:hypothetical protein B0H14DRAFT_3771691 [Mycena olivaceomarginata]|nr:hypothetical protein B0H14DRAFT_3771691 [Mycena olivaceomarginata]